nr:orf307 [Zancudomyces culisetae]AAW49507.1 orf307 [Zancudomyces culisetae]
TFSCVLKIFKSYKIELYAGNLYFNYLSPLGLFIKPFGKILNKEQFAGNQLINVEDIKNISDHMNKHSYPESDNDFGYYLAGLIEGDGYFGKLALEIIFNEKDISLAYFIKKKIGYGNIYKIKNKKAYKYYLSHKEGLKKVLDLTNGKFITNNKIDQLIKYSYNTKFSLNIKPPASFSLLKNYWLAGFSDADSSFCITIAKSSTHKLKYSVRLEFKIKQKDPTILKKIFKEFGGNLNIFNTENIYCYNSTNFKVAKNIINYFDNYHLNSSKYREYFRWRKAYRIIQRKEHLTLTGLIKILKLKKNLRS